MWSLILLLVRIDRGASVEGEKNGAPAMDGHGQQSATGKQGHGRFGMFSISFLRT